MMKTTQYAWPFYIVIAIIVGFVSLQDPNIESRWPLFVILTAILLLFYKLTIRVDENHVRFSMGVGLIRGKYKIEDIVYCRPISYVAFGWGIRLRQGAILFNVSGNKAIEIDIRGKSRLIWLGTNIPDEITAFINAKRKERSYGVI